MFYHGYDNYMAVAFPEDEVGFSDKFLLSYFLADARSSFDQYPANL